MAILKKVHINDELTFEVPAPKDLKSVLFKDRKKADQHWPFHKDRYERANLLYKELDIPSMFFDWNESTLINQEDTEYDNAGFLTSLSVSDTEKLVKVRDRELLRRQEGLYFWNNGEIEYLTGDFYFFLMYYVVPDFGLPAFRKYQRDVFYVIQKADADPECLGAFFPKAKKTGLSHVIAALFLNKATMMRSKGFGCMNKNQHECNELNMQFIFLAYDELPAIVRPRSSDRNKSTIKFSNPVVKHTGTKASKEKAKYAERNKALNSFIVSAATKKEVKFDGPLMYYIHLDEFPKWKVDLEKFFAKISETVKLQQTINGKLWITSYPPEEDTPEYEQAKVIYMNSKLRTIKTVEQGGLGRTASGLICHFISALVSTDGTFDIYGNANQMEARRKGQAFRDAATSQSDLQGRIRQYPWTEEECWRSGGSGSTFDNKHLAEVLEKLEKKEQAGEELSIRGDFEWIVKPRHTMTIDGERLVEYTPGVRFVRYTAEEILKSAGKIKAPVNIYEPYAATLLNKIIQDDEGNWMPNPDCFSLATCDPTEYKKKGDVDRSPSNWAITVGNFHDTARNTMLQRTASNIEIMDYVGRYDDPEDDFDLTIKTIFYYGCYILVEANKAWVVTEMKKRKLHKFLLLLQKDGSIRPYTEGEANKDVTSSTNLINEYCRLLNIYLRRPQEADAIDYAMLIRNKRTIHDLMRFDPLNTTQFDKIVTLGLWRVATTSFEYLRDKLKEQSAQYNYMNTVGEMILRAV